ncbi:pentapeptide repeat-containing protein [Nostoc sp.]|uniref:pentapeptide repeat-containing protein n=1 Tax=Nostoc sp. TaxID=1180 RepID=UPI002FF557CD
MVISRSIDVEELLQLYAAGERDFSFINIEGSDELYRANLSGINLSNSSVGEIFMEESNLSGANLKGAQLGQTCLRNTNLRGADLTSADLRYVNLDGADLTDAKLTNACLRNVVMRGANLTDADLTGAEIEFIQEMVKDSIFCRTIMPDGSIYNGTI